MPHLRHTQYQITTRPILSDISPDENIIPWFMPLTGPVYFMWWRDWFRVGFTLTDALPDPVVVNLSATEINSDVFLADILVAFTPVPPDVTMSATETNGDIFSAAILIFDSSYRAKVSIDEIAEGGNPASLWEE